MADFQNIKKELLPILQEAEKARKKYHFYKKASSLFILTTFLSLFISPFFSYFFNYQFGKWATKAVSDISPFSVYAIIFASFVLFYVILIVPNIHKKKFKTSERKILKIILNKIAPGFKFYERKQVTSEEIIDSKLIRTYRQVPRNNRYGKYEKVYNLNFGLLSGKIGDTIISIGDVRVFNQSLYTSYLTYFPFLIHFYLMYKYIKSWFSKKTMTLVMPDFTGMFAMVDFNKRLNGTTLILPDKFEKRISYLAKTLQSLNLRKERLVNLEDPTFEKEFVVYGTDQVEARYILSPSLMNRISALQRKVGSSMMLSFKNDKMYMAIEHPYGFFSLNESKNLITSDALELFYEDITNAIGIVEDLNLNTKLWKN